MNTKHFAAALTVLFVLLTVQRSNAQAVFSEDFTGPLTTNSWYFFRGACLTASSANPGANPGTSLPGCTSPSLKTAYYFGENQVGGTAGVSGNAQTLPDAPTTTNGVTTQTGALRFTNGAPFGFNEGGAIISAAPFDTTNGVQITFKSVTYRGNSGGSVGDGADGISFFMVNGTVAPSIGSEGGSLAYTCSNPGNLPAYNANGTVVTGSGASGHPIIDGVTGAYIGLGIDEYGNFLNQGDNTASGWGAQGDRIGLRGAGTVSWTYLSTTYPAYYPPSLLNTAQAQQAAVSQTCQSGYLWNYSVPSSPTPVLNTAMTVTTGSFSGLVTRRSNTITSIPYVPLCLVPGATITDTGGYIPAGTTVQSIGGNSITLSNSASSTASRNGTGDTINYSSICPYIPIPDYQAIPNGYTVLTGVNIANESAMSRVAATPIFYNLKITPNGLLSLSYSLSGAAYQSVLTNQDITQFNGPMPSSLLFGFAGSTGGATNIHEIMCFKAAPANTSGSSATVNEKESAKIETGTQAFFAFYDPNNWTGTVTANALIDTAGVVSVAAVANWDASCVLTGTASGTPLPLTGTAATGPVGGCFSTQVAGPTSPLPNWNPPGGVVTPTRVMLTWDTSANVGIPLEWTGTQGVINANEEATLDALDSTLTTPPPASSRLSFLRGQRSHEISPGGVGFFRPRSSLLGDIVDSSPTWVGPPSLPYATTWTDRLQSTDSMVENSGTQNYSQYASPAGAQSRANVVYVGANDGFLHGFRAGAEDSSGNLITTTTPNDGQEVLAYMPGSILYSAANATVPATLPPNCTDHSHTQSVVQNIHGVTPIIGANPLCVDASLDFANPQYGHNFFVDATPGTGDLFYNGAWHTWLVGGLGTGGAAIYALDITNPGNFTEGNASSVVLGEWNPSTLTNLGNTFGTPQIRRLHNGKWGAIFGNGFGSTSGDAGIYVMSIDASSGSPVETFYYLSTGTGTGTATTPCSSNCNGIAYVTAADLDGDHVTDYVYAGDLKGNVWRFDLTSANPVNWAAASAPLFTTPSGQPITTQLLVLSSTPSSGAKRVMVEFATGQRTQVTNTTAVSYASGTQAIYGIWDWNLSGWNSMSSMQYSSLAAASSGLSAPYTIPSTGTPITSLAQQVLTINANLVSVDGTNNAVCWQGGTACTTNNQFGWYANLPGASEQVIYNPVFFQGAILVDSTVPVVNTPTSCTQATDTGFTYGISVANGGIFTNAFPKYTKNGTLVNDSIAAGVQTNATGSVYVVKTAEGTTNLIYQTISGHGAGQEVNIPPNTKSKRLTWVERQ